MPNTERFGIVPTIIGCVCFGNDYVGSCVCDDVEKFLRAQTSPNHHPPALTSEQRVWCLDEIRSVEGWSDYREPESDSDLCRDVLSAWRDFARDKGCY